MAVAPGYLMNLEVIPPLIFPFQFNPDFIQDKKSFKYDAAQQFGQWSFDQTRAGAAAGGIGSGGFASFTGGLVGLYKDIKEFGPLITATKPIEPQEGEPRTIGLEFALDATVEGPYNLESENKRDIVADLAVLRSFMYPNWELTTLLPELLSSGTFPCWNRPPTCSFSYAGISMAGVITDLNIKIVSFDEKGQPTRAEVSVNLKEQTRSISTLIDTVGRYYQVLASYENENFLGFGQDWGEAFISPFMNAFG